MRGFSSHSLYEHFAAWLNAETQPPLATASELSRAAPVLVPGDVVLVEGRSRIAQLIKRISRSPWTHSAIFVGRIVDWENAEIATRMRSHWAGRDDDYLLLEAELGAGAILSHIDKYRHFNVRICRPQQLTHRDAEKIVAHGLSRLGHEYDVRQLFDLARLMTPWCLFPRRWRSSLFTRRSQRHRRTICSTLIADAFYSVDFPIQPIIREDKRGRLQMNRPNALLCTPKDFDTSPYFDILKFPWIPLSTPGVYHCFPWEEEYTPPSADPEPPTSRFARITRNMLVRLKTLRPRSGHGA